MINAKSFSSGAAKLFIAMCAWGLYSIDAPPAAAQLNLLHLWNLPAELNSANTEIIFEVDSTWHTVHGKVKELSGSASVSDPADYRSIKLEVDLPVAGFDTDNGSRDKKMRESMEAERFPNVRFVLRDTKADCRPDMLIIDRPCEFSAVGDVTIRDVTKPVPLALTVTQLGDGAYQITGKAGLDWPAFGVQDPSILIARLDRHVSINFKLRLPKKA